MTLGLLFLLAGAACLVMAFRRLRTVTGQDGAVSDATRLVIAQQAGEAGPSVTLMRAGGIAFGPCRASWEPPWDAGVVPAPVSSSGEYRVAAKVDLGAEDAFGLEDPGLAKTLRGAFESIALLLLPAGDGRPILLHGLAPGARGSAGGIGIEPARLEALLGLIGDPAGLRVEVVRRRVQRAGWGGAQGQRQRARQ